MLHSPAMRVAAFAAATVLGVVVFWALLAMPPPPVGLAAAVRDAGARSAVAHPVTAVLLEFRAWDTCLEVGVLLLAVIGATTLAGIPKVPRRSAPGETVQLPLVWLVRIVVPGLVLAAGHVLLLGTMAPGGAFHAGALLAAAAVLLELGGYQTAGGLPAIALRVLWVCGFAAFLSVGFIAMGGGRVFLELAPDTAGASILLVETAVAIAIAAGLASLFLAARAAGEDG